MLILFVDCYELFLDVCNRDSTDRVFLAKTDFEPSQTSKVELFKKQLLLAAFIFVESSILDVWLGSK